MMDQAPKVGDPVVVLSHPHVFQVGRGWITLIRDTPPEYGISMVDPHPRTGGSTRQFLRRECFKVLPPGVTLTYEDGSVWPPAEMPADPERREGDRFLVYSPEQGRYVQVWPPNGSFP